MSKKIVIAHHYPGIYQMQVPYIVDQHIPDKNGVIPTKKCDVEIHVGGKNNGNYLCTVIISTIKGEMSPTNYIQDVVSIIYNEYLPRLITTSELYLKVRWIQREYYPEERFNEVNFKWDNKSKRLIDPSWFPITDDWIITNHKLPKY